MHLRTRSPRWLRPAGRRALAYPGPSTVASAAPGAPETLAPTWRAHVDSQSELIVFEGAVLESGWEGVIGRRASNGKVEWAYTGREPFRAAIREQRARVLYAVDGFAVAKGRHGELARFDASASTPRWSSDACGEVHDARRWRDPAVAAAGARADLLARAARSMRGR